MNTVLTIGNCPQCGSSEVRKLASVYSAGMGGVISEKGENFSGANTSGVAIAAAPPQKMANWTGWTLSILLWAPMILIWMFLLITIQRSAAGRTWQEAASTPVALLTAVVIVIAAWSIPAWRQRHRAQRYNGEVWGPAMKHWHDASVCLNCCKVYN